jgi:hypothetical protein
MLVMSILDQLSSNFSKPTPAALEGNDNMFHRPYSATDPPELLFGWIEECAEIPLLGRDPYTDRQLINNAIRLPSPLASISGLSKSGTGCSPTHKHGSHFKR